MRLSPPIVFLDVDGVLNSREMMLAGQWSDDPADQIDTLAVERLERLVKTAGARIVVSSSWRLWQPALDALLRALEKHGMRPVGKTPYGSGERGDEIQTWLDGERGSFPAPFVILDDSDDMAHLRHSLVQTTSEKGILDEHVDLALALLQTDALSAAHARFREALARPDPRRRIRPEPRYDEVFEEGLRRLAEDEEG